MKLINYILLLLFGLFFLTACSSEQKKKTKPQMPPLKVKIITVKKEAVPIWKQYTGTTKASSDQEVRARVPGVLKKFILKMVLI